MTRRAKPPFQRHFRYGQRDKDRVDTGETVTEIKLTGAVKEQVEQVIWRLYEEVSHEGFYDRGQCGGVSDVFR